MRTGTAPSVPHTLSLHDALPIWTGIVSQFKYTWVRDGIIVGSGVAYRITVADKGHLLWCVVTAAGSDGSTEDRKSTRLNSSHRCISYAVLCLKQKQPGRASGRPS